MDFDNDFKLVVGRNWKKHVNDIEWADRYPVIDSIGNIIGWQASDDIPENAVLWAMYENHKRRSFRIVSHESGGIFGFDAIELR